jgi:hypothetical protein
MIKSMLAGLLAAFASSCFAAAVGNKATRTELEWSRASALRF